MGCQYLDELYELFALGTLEGEKALDLRDHLERNCPYCVAHFREATQTVYLLISLARPSRPDPKRKREIVRSVRKGR